MALHKNAVLELRVGSLVFTYGKVSIYKKFSELPFFRKQLSWNYQVDEWRLSFHDLLLSSARLQSRPIWVIDSETPREGAYNEVTLERSGVESVSGKTAQYC